MWQQWFKSKLNTVQCKVRNVCGKSGDFTLYNLKIGKTWNGNLAFKRGIGMWNITRQIPSGILKVLCTPFLMQ